MNTAHEHEHEYNGAADAAPYAPPWPFDAAAGVICLEFANTLGDRPVTSPREETLHGYDDLLAWAAAMDTLPGSRLTAMRAAAGAKPDAAAATFAAAIALREAIYRVFSAVAAGDTPLSGDLDALNAAYGRAMRHAAVTRATGKAFAPTWAGEADALDAALWPVARSAVELLLAPDLLTRLRECAGPDCSWLFLDRTKNGSRHWCNMRTCGNRAKARRHRAVVGGRQSGVKVGGETERGS